MPPAPPPPREINNWQKYDEEVHIKKYSPNFKRHENNIKHAWYLILCYNVIEAVPHNCY